jgi:hypothetical protein
MNSKCPSKAKNYVSRRIDNKHNVAEYDADNSKKHTKIQTGSMLVRGTQSVVVKALSYNPEGSPHGFKNP